jgi:uncharacterized membrane protein
MNRALLLYCGPLSVILYTAMNLFIPAGYPGYDSVDLTISELSAIGAPTRTVWVVLGFVYTLLVIGFAIGVLHSATGNHKLRITGWLLLVYGISGFLWPFFPMHAREVIAAGGDTITDTLHISLGVVSVMLMTVMICFGALSFDNKFRSLSFVILALMLFFGTLTGIGSPGINAGTPTPWLGLWERLSLGAFLVWMVMLYVKLIQKSGV